MAVRTKLHAMVDAVVAAAFVLAIALPIVDEAFSIDPAPPPRENRKLAERPPLPRSLGALRSFPQAFEQYHADHFGFRRSLIRAHSIVKYFGLRMSGTPTILAGRDGWLFYTGERALECYRASDPFEPQELAAWRASLLRRRRFCEERGIRFLFLVAPEKATIYPDFMPSAVTRLNAKTRLDQLAEALAGDGILLDPRPLLWRARASGKVYWKLDTHWNQRGAWLVAQAIMARVRPWFPDAGLPPDCFMERSVLPRTGSMAQMLALGQYLREDDVVLDPVIPRASAYEARIVHPDMPWAFQRTLCSRQGSPDIVFFHDSFGDYLCPFLSEGCHRLTAVRARAHAFDPGIIVTERPQVVVFEIAERYLMGPPPHPI